MTRKYRLRGALRLIFGGLTDTSSEALYEPLEFKKEVRTATLRAETKLLIRYEDIPLFQEQGLLEIIENEDENIFS